MPVTGCTRIPKGEVIGPLTGCDSVPPPPDQLLPPPSSPEEEPLLEEEPLEEDRLLGDARSRSRAAGPPAARPPPPRLLGALPDERTELAGLLLHLGEAVLLARLLRLDRSLRRLRGRDH